MAPRGILQRAGPGGGGGGSFPEFAVIVRSKFGWVLERNSGGLRCGTLFCGGGFGLIFLVEFAIAFLVGEFGCLVLGGGAWEGGMGCGAYGLVQGQ